MLTSSTICFSFCYPVNDASGVQVPDATEDLVEQIGHPLMIQVHVNHLAQAGIHQLHHKIPKSERMKRN